MDGIRAHAGPAAGGTAGGQGVAGPGVQRAGDKGRREGQPGSGCLPFEVGVDWINDMPTHFGTPSDYCNLRVLADTPKLKHVVVCTLCSCYPRPILGQSPEWYRTPNYRRRLVRWPRQVLAAFGLQLDPDVEIRVADSNQKTRYIVMPVRPEGTEGWSEEQLAEIVTRDCLIGVAVPKPGVKANAKRPVHPAVHPVQHDHDHDHDH